MKKELEDILLYLKEELAKLRAGRASIDLVENIKVDAYDAQMPLNQLATLSIPEPRQITIQPWDKNIIKNIEAALRANLGGLNPTVDGETIRVSIPEPTEERRRDLVKEVGKIIEGAQVKIRRVREDELRELKSKHDANALSEDEFFVKKDEVQKAIDDYAKKADEAGRKKVQEIMSI